MNSFSKIKILAVDDDQDILYTLEAIGKTIGWKMHTASDGISGVEKLRLVRPDLILLDYHMPKQDGLTTVKAIRAFDKIVPIIVLTVDERQEIADQFLDAGANDFANKPIKVPDLAARIKIHINLLQKQREMEMIGATFVNKGINEGTLELVRNYCRLAEDFFYIEDAAENTGLAYQTTVRYLQYLHNLRELAVINDYGRVGRPRKKYRYITSSRN